MFGTVYLNKCTSALFVISLIFGGTPPLCPGWGHPYVYVKSLNSYMVQHKQPLPPLVFIPACCGHCDIIACRYACTHIFYTILNKFLSVQYAYSCRVLKQGIILLTAVPKHVEITCYTGILESLLILVACQCQNKKCHSPILKPHVFYIWNRWSLLKQLHHACSIEWIRLSHLHCSKGVSNIFG